MHRGGNPADLAHPVPDGAPSYRTLLRKMQSVLGNRVWSPNGTGTPLEASAPADPPTISSAEPIEQVDRARPIRASGTTSVDAFLDGIQRTSIVLHVDAIPVVHAFVAAVIRQRVDRRMETWGKALTSRALYLPRSVTDAAMWSDLEAQDVRLIDTAVGSEPVVHPLTYRRAALDRVAIERERLEQSIATSWNDAAAGWLWVDGGVSGIPALRAQTLDGVRTFGVVKSHATLYGDAAIIASTLRLDEALRSAAFLILHRIRLPVISWYVRLRAADNCDPLHGLVRVELLAPESTLDRSTGHVTIRDEALGEITELADMISTWIMAERLPVSLPDARWDRLTYGVHDCERYLAALVGTH